MIEILSREEFEADSYQDAVRLQATIKALAEALEVGMGSSSEADFFDLGKEKEQILKNKGWI